MNADERRYSEECTYGSGLEKLISFTPRGTCLGSLMIRVHLRSSAVKVHGMPARNHGVEASPPQLAGLWFAR